MRVDDPRAAAVASETTALSPHAAVNALVGRLDRVGTERIGLSDAMGRVLGQRLVCDRPSPAADVSAMDGFAVRHADLARDETLPIRGEVRIGEAPQPLPERSAMRIVTGGGIPPGADTVIRREDTEEFPDRIVVRVAHLARGENVRRRGENAATGYEVVPSGTVITPPVAAALATFGCARPIVHRRVRVGLIVTGDEVKDVDAELTPWLLRDSNGPALVSIFSPLRWLDVAPVRRGVDDPDVLQRTTAELLEACDALVLTGGVSMGGRDFVPGVLRALGAEIVFHRIRQRPGKPVLGARGPRGQAILGLPGNPVSVLVTARRMAVPVLGHMAGMAAVPLPVAVAIDAANEAALDLWWHRPIRLTATGRGALVSARGSGDVVATALADGFVEVPPNETGPGPWPYYPWTT
jgi:molybdopterin molybdotransferase